MIGFERRITQVLQPNGRSVDAAQPRGVRRAVDGAVAGTHAEIIAAAGVQQLDRPMDGADGVSNSPLVPHEKYAASAAGRSLLVNGEMIADYGLRRQRLREALAGAARS